MPRQGVNCSARVVKKFPTSENGPSVHCITESKQEYFITQCLEKMRFTLWRKIECGYEQIAMAKSPVDLEDKIPWNQ